ncbi:hypothetical protein ACSQ6I_08355 [Anabaena sp. WFMT]|uniref:hypothetical protein n=1 Tax=Anabaena sp. WFMT TaxID=3449730 RepID=UPI003F296AA0
MRSLNLSQVKFTNNADQVRSNHGILNPTNATVNTFNGGDQIIGTESVSGDFGFGVLVGIKAKDLSSIIASAEFSQRANVATEGIQNKGSINTGKGDDQVIGTATANISVTAATVSQAIAIARYADATVITNAFASIKVNVTADGIDNSDGKIKTGQGNDGIYGNVIGSISSVATAYADASGIVEAICKAPMSEGLTAFARAMATSLAKANIIARGINNTKGEITTGEGNDTIHATATSRTGTFADTYASTLASAAPENQALAEAVANAFAEAKDKAIAIDNTRGYVNTGSGADNIFATAKASNKAIAIDNTNGEIRTEKGNDTIIAKAIGTESCGIFGGIINMGDGDDRLEASSFGGGVNIKMGKGQDFVQGFGDATVNGGEGFDILCLGSYNKSDFNIYMKNGFTVFELDGTTMKTTGFEDYIFADVRCSSVLL